MVVNGEERGGRVQDGRREGNWEGRRELGALNNAGGVAEGVGDSGEDKRG